MKHRYSIPYEWKYYGYMYRYRVRYRPPLFNHIYYLLDLSKTKEIDELLFHYLNKKEEEWEGDRLAGKIEIQNQPSFSPALSIIKQTLLLLIERNSKKRYLSPSELNENCRRSTEMFLCTSRWRREYDLLAAKNRVHVSEYPLREKESKEFKNIIDFFTSKGFSLQDILIRCSTEHTFIEGDRPHIEGAAAPLLFPMIHYSTLWHAMERHGLLKNSNERDSPKRSF